MILKRFSKSLLLPFMRIYYWVLIKLKGLIYSLPFDRREIPYLPSLLPGSKSAKAELAYNRTRILDCCYFFNEFELLEMRLKLLSKYVDKFIVIESKYDLSGKIKSELLYERIAWPQYSDYQISVYVVDWLPSNFENLDKRISMTTDDCERTILLRTRFNDILPVDGSGPVYWINEFYFKEWLLYALNQENIDDTDLIFISDVDEFWNPLAKTPRTPKIPVLYKLKGYIYKMNNLSNDSYKNWTGTCSVRYSLLRELGVNVCRAHNIKRRWLVYKGGWHFSAMGGVNKVREKISIWDPNDFGEDVLDDLEQTIMESKDLRGRDLTTIRDDKGLPESISEFRTKFPNFFTPGSGN